jgi:hypothetical protein
VTKEFIPLFQIRFKIHIIVKFSINSNTFVKVKSWEASPCYLASWGVAQCQFGHNYRVCQGSWPLQSEKCALASMKMLASMFENACRQVLVPYCFEFFDCFVIAKTLVKAKKATKNWRFDIYVYEGQDRWHTR